MVLYQVEKKWWVGDGEGGGGGAGWWDEEGEGVLSVLSVLPVLWLLEPPVSGWDCEAVVVAHVNIVSATTKSCTRLKRVRVC
jgi:hypothetical protein